MTRRTPSARLLLTLRVALIIASLGGSFSALAAPPPPPPAEPEHVPIWDKPAEDGVAIYRIPQVLVTRAGTVLACAEARYQKGDGSKADVVIRRSEDGGRAWSKSLFVDRSDGKENLVLPVLLEDHDTKRIYFFCALRDAGIRDTSTRSYYRTSDDDGRTWSDRVDVTPVLTAADVKVQADIRAGRASQAFAGENPDLYGRQLLFFGPGRGIQLSSTHKKFPGRLVVPVFLIKDRLAKPRSARGYGDGVLFSDDHGKTWQAGIVPIGSNGSSEVSVVELDDGRLLLNARAAPDYDNGAVKSAGAPRTVAYSEDGGATWTRPIVDVSGLPVYRETHSGLLRIPAAKIGNPSAILFSFPAATDARRDGTIYLSRDGHQSWSAKKLIARGSYGYSNLDQLQDGTVIVVYESSGGGVRLGRFTLDWLTTAVAATP